MLWFEGLVFVRQTAIALKKHFPKFLEMLDNLPDNRKNPEYETHELLMAVIAMFVFKRGSRNHMDNSAKKGGFAESYEKLFQCRLPDMDTADRLMRTIPVDEVEKLKREMVSVLVRRKVFDRFRFGGRLSVAFDGSGIYSFDYEPYPGCPKKTSKNGKTTYTVYVLEAKLVCSNGFSISMATEWIRNPENGTYEKQDCELKAFVRLAAKVKTLYPRLPILILADGLYPNQTVFNICKKNDWPFIFTFKDGNLQSVWEEIVMLTKLGSSTELPWQGKVGPHFEKHIYKFINGIDYNDHNINFIESIIEKWRLSDKTRKNIEHERFVHITSFGINKDNYRDTSICGRLRWKIENEGFNSQKNSGYGLTHKFSRTSHQAACNYYQCLQIAHTINQLAYLTKFIKQKFLENNKETIKSLTEFGLMLMFAGNNLFDNMEDILSINCQLRY